MKLTSDYTTNTITTNNNGKLNSNFIFYNYIIMETINYKGYTITIDESWDIESPRERDNLWWMVCDHKRYDLWDEKAPTEIDYYDRELQQHTYRGCNDWEDVAKQLHNENNIAVILPLSLYDHSWISMRVWVASWYDSWQVWFIYATIEDIRKEYGVQRISKQLIKKIEWILEQEVAIYSQYLEWDYYYTTIEKDWEYIDGGSEFWYDECVEFAKQEIDRYIKKDQKKAIEKRKQQIKSKTPLQYRTQLV